MIGWAVAAAWAADVTINEVYADAPGADAGLEWVELFNAGPEPVDLEGWALYSGTSSLSERHRFGAQTTLGAGARLTVGGAADVVADVALGNAGSSADAVQLRDASGAVVDTVVYGGPNTDGFVDDEGSPAADTPPSPPEGLSLQRSPDGADGGGAADFVVGAPTPGAPNPAPLVCAAGLVLVNELLPDPNGADEGGEWVELFNAGDADVPLAGWTLSFATRDPFEPTVTFGDEVVAAGAFLLVGGADVGADVVTDASMGNGTETDGVRLTSCDGAFTDTALYGEAPNEDGLTDDRGLAADPYGHPGVDQSLARWADGADTDTPLDWRSLVAPTPGAPNPGPPEVDAHDPPGERPGRGGCGGRPSVAALALLGLLRPRYLLARATSSCSPGSTSER